ncbi:heme/hemin ABC transporter substrate-binding protein [Puniceibacterium sediminis]|uniref:Iron complex transport system substrate-binding protein n=1 Tax=Puniceibacterium sediminis TaxID=1608407 RepID=A0A238YR45_9RHOB|nr:ABC transporter substrate-binding protein [Puniceibacterium sediminis]SNR73452.1 iron complex transport system substrate-binding protein [Puniceibacterium sediminis]
MSGLFNMHGPRWLLIITVVLASALVFGSAAEAGADTGKSDRIVSLGGSVTEIIYALGAGSRVIARDTTSSFPPEAEKLPDVGYLRALSPEGVLSVSPGLIIAEEGAGPPETIDVLRNAKLPYFEIPESYDRAGIVSKILAVGDAINEAEKARVLANALDASLGAAQARAEARGIEHRKRVLFILSTQNDRILASGTGTAAAGIIALAGGDNAVTSFEGYKPLTDEAIIAAAPDVILMMDRGGDHGAANGELLAMPAVTLTPAGKSGAVVRMDGLYLLGFGPRTADAVNDLSAALYGG